MHFHRLACAGLLSLLAASAARAFVGVNDPCAFPTPHPPPGAGAGVIFNASMEGGFTAGAAQQWTAWKDAPYTGQVHFTGSDRFFDGSFSQKLDLPQPQPGFGDQEAGLYQRIWVVPGANYTATARFYLEFPPETYTGEDLIAWMGLDPFGEASGDGSGMIWSTNVATKGQWVQASVSAQAALAVMTLSVKGTRKFAQHGNGAKVWIDAVTFSGPIPTGSPPGPEPDPIDPETLIPAAAGPNLVSNPSFESAFTGGVSAGWNAWSTAGTGTWRRTQRVGKIGGGRYDCGDRAPLGNMYPKTILLMGGTPSINNPNDPGGNGVYPDLEYLLSTFPHLEDTIFVGRPYIDPNGAAYMSNPTFYGRQLADQMWLKQQQFPRIDCWQGLNEPDTGGTWQAVIAFEKAFADRCHELGLKACSLNLSTGSPGNIWRMVDERFDPSCRDLLEVTDYLGHHPYGGPHDDLMVTNQDRDDVCSLGMRPRRFKDMYDRRGWRFPPVIATEGPTFGPSDNWGDAELANDLTTAGDYMNANRWWCGYTNFVVGGSCGWSGWEIADRPAVINAVAAWNQNHPADAIDGLYSQMFGAGKVHPKTLGELPPAGVFNGGINRQITGLIPGQGYLFIAWMKYEFRGLQPAQLKFYLGVDSTGQTASGSAASIDWGADQIADKAPIHEIYSHVWRTFTATASTVSIWLRASHPVSNPSFMCYVDQVEVRQIGTAAPWIELSTQEIALATAPGVNPPNGAFTIRNAGPGTLDYTIGSDAAWLAAVPAQGTSAGEPDPIAVVYAAGALPPGVHTGHLTVTAPAAANSPQTITVQLTIQTARPDFDADGDVDQEDFARFQLCLSGPGFEQADPDCAPALLDADSDVDGGDLAIFAACMSGPNVLADPACAPQ